jgi:tRNA wybutosine-synthesizing protein 1
MWCDNSCIHCWRPIEYNLGKKLPKDIDDPKEIIDRVIEERKRLLSGFPGNEKVSKEKFKEALNPTLFTLSLSGEPTLYPRLPELIREIRRRKAVSFIVTNGLHPEMLKKLEKENALPTQLTISTNAGNEELFLRWCNPKQGKKAWKSFIETIKFLKKIKGKTRRVIRLTLAKPGKNAKNVLNEITNMSDKDASDYVKLITLAEPDFVHVKGFKSLGYSRERGMTYDKIPWFAEVKAFAKKLLDLGLKDLGYKYLADEENSAIVVLGKNKKAMKITKV